MVVVVAVCLVCVLVLVNVGGIDITNGVEVCTKLKVMLLYVVLVMLATLDTGVSTLSVKQDIVVRVVTLMFVELTA